MRRFAYSSASTIQRLEGILNRRSKMSGGCRERLGIAMAFRIVEHLASQNSAINGIITSD